MIEWLSVKRFAALEEVGNRAVQLALEAGRYARTTSRRSRGGKGGKASLIHWTCLSSQGRARYLSEQEQAGPQAVDPRLQALLSAPAWAREKAEARFELLGLIDRQVAELRRQDAGLTARKALDLVVRSFNLGALSRPLHEALGEVSPTTIYRWRQRLTQGGGPSALLPDHGGGPKGALSAEMKAAVGSILMAPGSCRFPQAGPPRRITARHIRHFLVVQFGREVPSYDTVLREVKRFMEAHQREICRDQAPTMYRRRMLPSLGRADRCAEEPNHVWEIDSTRADLIFKDGRRRIGINVIDVFSRRAVIGLYERDNVWAVCQTLRKAFLKLGLPRRIKMDNGLNYYKSSHVHLVCAELGIEVVKLPPRRPDKKPFTERFFGTWQNGLLSLLEGYTSNNVATRPEILLRRYAPEEIQAKTDAWVNVYEETVHSETDQRPRERHAQPGFRPRMISDVRDLDILLMPVETRTVKAASIQFRNHIYFAPQLAAWEGQEVVLRQPEEDAGRLIVHSAERPGRKPEFICQAEAPEIKGWPVERVAEEKARLRRADKLRLELAKLEFQPVPLSQHVDGWLNHAAQEAPLAFPQRAEIIELPVAYREAAEALEAQDAPEAESTEAEPDYFGSDGERYKHLITRRVEGREPTAPDLAFMARFETSEEFEEQRSYFESWEAFLRATQARSMSG